MRESTYFLFVKVIYKELLGRKRVAEIKGRDVCFNLKKKKYCQLKKRLTGVDYTKLNNSLRPNHLNDSVQKFKCSSAKLLCYFLPGSFPVSS